MKKFAWVGLLAVAGLLFAKGMGQAAAADVKIGVVDVNKVFSNYARVTENQAEFDEFQKEHQAEANKKAEEINKEIKALQDKLDNQGKVLKKEESEKIKNEIADKSQDLMDLQNKLIQELRKKNGDMVEARVNEIKAAIGKVAREKGYTVVLLKDTVLYSPDAADLTDQVTAALNKSAAKK